MNAPEIAIAAIHAPGRAIFGTCLLDLTQKAWDLGINLSGADICAARHADRGGYWVSGTNEDKYYGTDGEIDN